MKLSLTAQPRLTSYFHFSYLSLPNARIPGVSRHTQSGARGFCSSQKIFGTHVICSAFEKAVFISSCGLGMVLSDQGYHSEESDTQNTCLYLLLCVSFGPEKSKSQCLSLGKVSRSKCRRAEEVLQSSEPRIPWEGRLKDPRESVWS